MSNDWRSATGISPHQTAQAEEEGIEIAPSLSTDTVIVVSNRQPYRHRYQQTGDGESAIAVDRPTGGLTAGLDPVMQRLNGTWIAWGDGGADRETADEDGQLSVPPEDPQYTLQRLWLTDRDVENYYYGYSNRALWPLCHLAMGNTEFDGAQWRQYCAVNRKFADTVLEHTTDGSVIWFQDYHLARTPQLVRSRCASDLFLLHFWHIPWPPVDVFRTCPQHRELLEGLLGNDLIGFHIPRYCRNFLECVDTLVEQTEVEYDSGRIRHEGHETVVEAFPMGVDAETIKQRSTSVKESMWRKFKRDFGLDPDLRIVLGVDRLDYTKGIPERLQALEHLWTERPEWRGAFTYVQKGSKSRSQIPAYQQLQDRVSTITERINDRFGTDDWQPVITIEEKLPRKTLCGLYRYSDVALVSPLRDGMNLVAQEYIASQIDDDGVLVLSELAGSHERLGDAVISVNPYDTEAHADAIERALTMPETERRHRSRQLRRKVHNNDINAWIDDVFDTVDQLRTTHDTGS